MTTTHAPRPESARRSVTVGRGRAVHTAIVYLRDGKVTGGYTDCGSEGRVPGSSRLYVVDAAVTCKRCASTDAIVASPAPAAEVAPETVEEQVANLPAAELEVLRTRAAALDALPTDDEPAEETVEVVAPAVKLTALQREALAQFARPVEEREYLHRVNTSTLRSLRNRGLVESVSTGRTSGYWTLTLQGQAANGDADAAEALRLGYATAEAYRNAPGRAPAVDALVDEVAARHGIEVPTVEEARAAVRISTREELIERQVAAGVTRERATMIADARDTLQAELTRNAPAIAAALDAPLPVHYTREQIAARFAEVDEFVLVLGPDDRAYDPETGDTFLGGVTIRYARGEFPGPARTATILDDEQQQADADTATGTDADRVTISARAWQLRPGDLVVDSLGNRQYAAFDVDGPLGQASLGEAIRVHTAVSDQERGLPPVITLNGERELLVSRRLTDEQQVEARELFGE